MEKLRCDKHDRRKQQDRRKKDKQRKRQTGGKLAACLLLFLGLVFFFQPQVQAEETTEKIRIGYTDFEGFIDMSRSGTYSGYGVDYLKEISEYTGWEYEYVYDSWENLIKSLEAGEIDFLMHAQRTEERSEKFLFSKYMSGSETNLLYVRSDDERYYYNDYDSFNGMKVAGLADSFQNEEFERLVEKKGFS